MTSIKKTLALLLALVMVLGCVSGAAFADGAKYSEETTADGWVKVTQDGGPTLGYDPASGVVILEDDGFAFKDLNKNGELDPYEDWRLSYAERAQDLVSRMSIEQLNGLRFNGNLGSLGEDPDALTDMNGNPMKPMIVDQGARYFIVYPVAFGAPLETVYPTTNMLQKLAESSEYGVPMMLNCDPTNTMTGQVSSLAQAATFDVEAVGELAKNVSRLYRAIGITMTLSPQVDLLTDPRSQSTNTFTEDPALAADLVNAIVSAYQSSYDADGNDLGWGSESLAVQFKHFFANLANEGGRNYHDFTGKYTVVPEDQMEVQLIPFVKGGFKLNGATGQASAIMVTYTVLCDEDGEPVDENRGGAWNEFIIETAKEHGFEGMLSTDSLIMQDLDLGYMQMLQTAYNVEDYSNVEAAYHMFSLGIDQSMGDLTPGELMEAYALFVEEEGQEAADQNWRDAAYRCVLPIFEVGNFENPYVLGSESLATIAALVPETVNELAQSSIVMVKNADGVIGQDGVKKVYIANEDSGLSKKTLKGYFEAVDTADEADAVVVFVQSPQNANTGYDSEAEEWVPISLQYREYCADADAVLEDSLTGDVTETQVESPYGMVTSTEKENRAYYDAETTVTNEADLDLILAAAETGKPVIVCVNATGAFCVDEFESEVAAILIGYGVDNANFLPLIAGQVEPQGLLPVQMPADMEAVEAQQSATPRDMTCYEDAEGNAYDFAFGLNWSGVIDDARTATYKVPVLTGLD